MATNPMPREVTDQKHPDAVTDVVKMFYQAHRMEGHYLLEFKGARKISDSDGDSVIDAYLNGENPEAAPYHLQLLGDMVPADALSNRYNVYIVPREGLPDEPNILLQTMVPQGTVV